MTSSGGWPTRGVDIENSTVSIYRYFDRYDVLLYVGITTRGTARQHEHNTTKTWWPLVFRQEVEHFSDMQTGLAVEKATIERFRPPFNTQHNPSAVESRDAYMRFAALAASAPSFIESYQSRKWIPLRRVADDLLVTRLDDFPIAKQLTFDRPRRVLSDCGGGTLLDLVVRGPAAFLNVRADALPEHAYARVRVVSLKDPVSARVTAIQSTSPEGSA